MHSPRIIQSAAICFVVIFLSGFGAGTAQAFDGGEPEVYGLAEYFVWREYNDLGAQILREAGPRFGVGFAYYRVLPDGMTFKPRVELFGGVVDYTGQACDNSFPQVCAPTTTDTGYFGFKFEMDIGGRMGQQFIVEPFGGIGLRIWLRDIHDSVDALGRYASGYVENWTTIYLRAGMRAETLLASDSRFFFEAGAKLPLYTENYINDISYKNITLEPKGRISPVAEVGFKAQRFKMSIYYDSMRFAKSNVVSDGLFDYWQPKSTSYIVGIRIGASF